MATWKQINCDTLQATLSNGNIINYTIVSGSHPVNEQQFNLPVGMNLKYPDGAMIIRIEGYYLLRHWFYEGKTYDRIAIPETDVYLMLN